jgi:Mce-associated membrane protein
MSTEVAEPTIEEPAVEEPVVAAKPRRSRLPSLLVAAAVVLAGAGAWFTVEANTLRSSDAAANHALADTGATAEVNSAVTLSLNRIFSYSYDKTEVTGQAASKLLRGKALDTYNQLFGQVRELAPRQKLVLSTRVVSSAVQSLRDDRAKLLVFLDQSATRADNAAISSAASQLSVTAEKQNGTWVITELTPR